MSIKVESAPGFYMFSTAEIERGMSEAAAAERARIVRAIRDRATEFRNRANHPDHAPEVRRGMSHTAQELGRLANEIERGR